MASPNRKSTRSSANDFANALRAILRHDPDVIMVGEIRDGETAEIAIRAALTGHLVLSTLHTNDAPSALTRLIDMGVADYLVASTLIGVLGQRLVRRRCRTCSAQDVQTRTGCPDCGGSGYRGRVALVEAMEMTDELRSALRGNTSADLLRSVAEQRGFVSMRADGDAKARAGRDKRRRSPSHARRRRFMTLAIRWSYEAEDSVGQIVRERLSPPTKTAC